MGRLAVCSRSRAEARAHGFLAPTGSGAERLQRRSDGGDADAQAGGNGLGSLVGDESFQDVQCGGRQLEQAGGAGVSLADRLRGLE